VSFDLPDINIIPGEKYYIVAMSNNGYTYHHYCWYTGPGNPYPDGHGWITGVPGEWYLTWDDTEDFCFKTLYKEEESNREIISILRQIFRENQYFTNLFEQYLKIN
jgi:hypothetical protein